MPRVHFQRLTFFALCAACGWGACSAEPEQDGLSTDDSNVTIGDDGELGGPSSSPDLNDVEESIAFCQSQFFGKDALDPEEGLPSCSQSLAVAVLNPANVVVTVAGQVRASGDSENGWQLAADGMTVQLLGTACDDVLGGADLQLAALCE